MSQEDADLDDSFGVEKPPTVDKNVVTFLALYLLLLAFFILLNAISEFKEDKVRAVLGSVSDKFTGTGFKLDAIDLGGAAGKYAIEKEVKEKLKGVFESSFAVVKVKQFVKGNVMRLGVDTEELFYQDEAKIRTDKRGFMENLANALENRQEGVRTEVQFLIGSGKELPSTVAGLPLQGKRAVVFAEQLRNLGVPQEAISVGMRIGNPRRIYMYFFTRFEHHAKIEFSELLPEQ